METTAFSQYIQCVRHSIIVYAYTVWTCLTLRFRECCSTNPETYFNFSEYCLEIF